jgi:hypothetical protein
VKGERPEPRGAVKLVGSLVRPQDPYNFLGRTKRGKLDGFWTVSVHFSGSTGADSPNSARPKFRQLRNFRRPRELRNGGGYSSKSRGWQHLCGFNPHLRHSHESPPPAARKQRPHKDVVPRAPTFTGVVVSVPGAEGRSLQDVRHSMTPDTQATESLRCNMLITPRPRSGCRWALPSVVFPFRVWR